MRWLYAGPADPARDRRAGRQGRQGRRRTGPRQAARMGTQPAHAIFSRVKIEEGQKIRILPLPEQQALCSEQFHHTDRKSATTPGEGTEGYSVPRMRRPWCCWKSS